jgi:hypothetical protein
VVPGRLEGLRGLAAAFILVASGLVPGRARADEEKTKDARAAYDRGAHAYDSGDYRLAVVELARADGLAPNDVALELALRAAIRQEDASIAMTLVERAEQRGSQGKMADAAQAVRDKFSALGGKITFTCPAPCSATIDGAPLQAGSSRWYVGGRHDVVIVQDGVAAHQVVELAPGSVRMVGPLPPPASAGSPSTSEAAASRTGGSSSRGVLPLVVSGVGLVVLGTGGVFAGLSASKASAGRDRCTGQGTDYDPASGRCYQPSTALDEANRLKAEARGFARAADILVPIGLVGVAVGAYLVFVRGGKKTAASSAGPWPRGGMLEGRF